MIGANTHRRCTDFDRDGEIYVVRFRERRVPRMGAGGQIRAHGSPYGASAAWGRVPAQRNSVALQVGGSLKSTQYAYILGINSPPSGRLFGVRLATGSCFRRLTLAADAPVIAGQSGAVTLSYSAWFLVICATKDRHYDRLDNATQDKTATQVRYPVTPGYWAPSLARYRERRSALRSAVRYAVTALRRPPQ
jgi:hypothetical protein